MGEIVDRALAEGRRKLLEHEALELCAAAGIPVPKYFFARSVDEALEGAGSVGYPVVVKVVSPDIVHKSDVGGVALNVADREGLVRAFNAVVENVRRKVPGARIEGVLVQEMLRPALEVVVGAVRDAVFGPVIMFGLGGLFVEVLKDVSFRVAPVDPLDAEEMIREVRGYRLLEGYRGLPPRDLRALKELIVKVSELVSAEPRIQELDLNPVMLFEEGGGAKVADARVILGAP